MDRRGSTGPKARKDPQAGARPAFYQVIYGVVEVTVSVNVVECITEPEVAVTVTVEGVPPAVEEVDPAGVVVEVLLQPTNNVTAATPRGSNIRSRPPR